MRKAWRKSNDDRHLQSRAWQLLRLRVLERDCWLCCCPDCMGGELRVTPATEVDHIKPRAQGGDDSLDNLRAVSAECHRRITLLQRGYRPRRRVGPDGWPVDD